MHTVWIDVASQADMSVRVLKRLIANAKPGELSAKDEADLVGRIMNYSGIKQRAIGKLRLQADKPASEWDEMDKLIAEEEATQGFQGDDTDDPGNDGMNDGTEGETPLDGTDGDEEGNGDTPPPV